ncbi:MAG: PAS domain S-box protein, partial [Gemmatimonadota bacterium]
LYYEGVLEDITARKEAEEKVREATQRIIHTLNSISDAFFNLDTDWRLTFLNERALEYATRLGAKRDEALGKSLWAILPDRVGSRGDRELRRAMADRIPVSYEFFYPRLETWFEVHAFPSQEGLSVYVRDVTERRQAEEALRDSQRTLSTLMSNLPGMAYRCRNDPDWTMELVSDGCRDLTGYDPDALTGNRIVSFGELIHPDDREAVWNVVQEALERREPYRLSYRLRTASGEEKWVWEQGRGIFGGDGSLEALEGFVTDITERKRAEQALQLSEEQLRLSQRLEAVGQLAGGVAHDFNNLLTAILGHAGLLLGELAPTDPMRSELEEIKKAGERAATLTRQLLAFSRKQMLRPKIFDLNVVVAEMNKMLRRLIGEDIELTTVLDESLGRVRADPGQIEQVIVNLAVNARDAMPEGGKLTIETANIELDERYAERRAVVQPGRYVMLAVSDTGSGMPPEIQTKIFEPFFTTKEVGKGTGLGLATVYGIVKQSEGYIWVYSEPGHGTTFKMYLPRVDAAAEPLTPIPDRAGLLRGTETVLVVEDEAIVRSLVRDILGKNGYRVLEAVDGEEALRLSRTHADPIHLLITDIVMPGMSGPELVETLAPERREMKVIYTSGYTDHAIVNRGVLDPSADFLQKPFTPDVLTRRVRDALDGTRSGERARPASGPP